MQRKQTSWSRCNLEFVGPSTLVGPFNKLVLTNVDIGSQFTSDANTGYFRIGLMILNAAGVVGTNVNIYTNAKTKVEYGDTNSKAIEILKNKTNHFMIRMLSLTNVYLQRYHTAVKCTALASGGNMESLYISQGEILAATAFNMNNGDAIFLNGFHSDVRDMFF